MSVKNENAVVGESVVLERSAAGGICASLCEKINLNPVSGLSALDIWQDAQAITEMTDPGDGLQASRPLRDTKVIVEDIEDNPGFFRVKLFAVPHFQVEGMDVNLSLVSQMPKAKA